MKKIIWALYDDGNMSWYNSDYDKSKYRVISIGINDHSNLDDYYQIDLRLSNENLIKQLSELPKPDIIVASPPCESWSIADNQQRLFRKIENIKDFNVVTFFTKEQIEHNNYVMGKNRQRDYFKQFRTMLIGMDTSMCLELIIKSFKPQIWIIENPQTSKIWDWLRATTNIGGYKNVAYYNNYDSNRTKKPTIFYSNKFLILKNRNIKQNLKWEQVSNYDKRSAIPKELILDILNQI